MSTIGEKNVFDLEAALLKWKGRVTNNEDELREVLNNLQREPKNTSELSDIILKKRNEQMTEVLSETNKVFPNKRSP